MAWRGLGGMKNRGKTYRRKRQQRRRQRRRRKMACVSGINIGGSRQPRVAAFARRITRRCARGVMRVVISGGGIENIEKAKA
jgi:predicted Rossmann-fold nucleotide-binding protein